MKKRYIRSFDGLRTLGVIAVILYHMFPGFLKGGYLGVALFFVVSGYLITDLLLQEYESSGRIRVGNFYLRRLKRLYPAMILVMLVTALYAAVFHPNFLNNMRMVFVSAIFSFNNWWQIAKGGSYFSHLMAEAPFTHFYSLAIEAQFYLVWPALLLLLLKTLKNKGKIFLTLCLVSLISVLEMALLFKTGQDPTRVYYGTDTRLFSILMGASLAFVWPSHKLHKLKPNAKGKRVFNTIFYSSLAITFLLLFFLPDQAWITYRGGMWLFSFVAMLLVALVAHPTLPYQYYFSNKVFDYIGSRSYGIYLWQMPILTFTELRLGKSWFGYLLATVIILLFSELSYRFVETPLRKASFSQVKDTCSALFKEKNWNVKRITTLTSLVLSLIALVTIFLSPSRNNEQAQIANEIATKQEAIKAANKEKKVTTKQVNQADDEIDLGDTSQFDDLATSYSVTSEQLALAAQTPILAVGDSVFTKTYDHLATVFPQMVMDAEFGLAPENALAKIQALLAQYPETKTVMISLGTNQGNYGIMTQEQVDEIMSALADKKVYWSTIYLPSSTYWWTNDINQLLKKAAKKYNNLTLVDWNKISEDHELDWFEADGFHPNDTGSLPYTKMWIDRLFKPSQKEQE